MIKFSPIRTELERLLIEELPAKIDNLNTAYNDGIMIYPFTNRTKDDVHLTPPYRTLTAWTAERTEKDILLENFLWTVKLQLTLPPMWKNKDLLMDRYMEAVANTLEEAECESWERIGVTGIKNNEINIRIVSA